MTPSAMVIPPFLVFYVGALVVYALKGSARSAFLLLLPLIGLLNILHVPAGAHWVAECFDFQIVLLQIDGLSTFFAWMFHVVAFLAFAYGLCTLTRSEMIAGMLYCGSALGVVFAGDFFSFYIFWELLGLSALVFILERRKSYSQPAALHYMLMHLAGGLCLLAGIVMHVRATGSLAVSSIELDETASILMFLGIGMNCAWPLFHTWLTDAYPKATIAGVVFLSALTTKTAVYALARIFPGATPLIWIGCVMAAFPIFYAVIENDLRKVLAYSLINQVGFMVVGIGIGTELAISGALAHAFNDVIFKGLLFMSVGAVMYRTGKVRATDLGGLYRCMPFTCLCCIVGAASISAFPLFSGFVSKSMVMSAAANEHYTFVWIILLFAAAGVFHHAGIKIPFFTFFGHDSGLRVKDAPGSMKFAMGVTALLCIVIGTFPHSTVYSLLPYEVTYEPYTVHHVVSQLQLLFFSALAFTMLFLGGIYPAEIRSTNIDADWISRKLIPKLLFGAAHCLERLSSYLERALKGVAGKIVGGVKGAPVFFVKASVPDNQRLYYSGLARLKMLPISITCAVSAILLAVVTALSLFH